MKVKQRLEIFLRNEIDKKVKSIFVEGYNIGFGRIMGALLKENEYAVQKKGRLCSIGIKHYTEENDGRFVESFLQPLITKEKFFNVARELLKKQKDYMKLVVEDIRFVSKRRYNSKEWFGEMPLTGAIDILFNNNLEYLIGKNPKELLNRKNV